MTTFEQVKENGVRAPAIDDDLEMGRGVRRGASRTVERTADDALWQQAFDEAVGQGAGPNVARVFANQTLTQLRAERDGTELPGARNFQAYR